MKKLQKFLPLRYIEDISANFITDFMIDVIAEKRREKIILKKTALIVVLILPLIFTTFLAMTPMASASTITLNTIADSWVEFNTKDPGKNTVNHGANVTLHARSDTSVMWGNVTKRIYLKFNLSGINPATIDTATLYLYCKEATIPPDYMDVDAHETGDGWIEGPGVGSINWNNAPAVGDYITTTAVDGINTWHSWGGNAMTNYVKAEAAGDGNVSFVVKLPDDIPPTQDPMWHRDFYSKEGGYSPYLEITEKEAPPQGGHMTPITMAEETRSPAFSMGLISALLVAMAVTTILIKYKRNRVAKTPKVNRLPPK